MLTYSAVCKPGIQCSNGEGDCSEGVAMGFRMAKVPTIFLARFKGNHIKIIETWQAASIIKLASFSLFFFFCPDLCLRPIYAFTLAPVWA